MTKIALTKGSLSIPPTYFAVQHALALTDTYDLRFFTMAARITDPDITPRLPVIDASEGTVAARLAGSWERREQLLPLMFRRMQRDLRAFAPQVIHQHFANWSQPAVAASKQLDVPLLLTVHGADAYVPLTPMDERNALGRPLLRWHQRTVADAFAHARRVLAVSEYLAGVAVQAGADAARVEVHYQGVDTELYSPSERARTSPARVVFVGRLSEAKGIPDLLAASIALAQTTPHELVIVGDGPLRSMVDAAAAAHPHIDVRGAQTRDGVVAALTGATVFVLPTRRNGQRREAAGLVSLEAQAAGVPAIVYDSGGAAEMLKDGSTGLVVTEGDVPALADAIRSYVTMPDAQWLETSERARAFVVAQRSLQASARELSDHYQDLIEAR